MAKPLPTSEWRARAEVRLQGQALHDFDLSHVSDLKGFSFNRLHSAGLFKFAKPLPGPGPLAANRWLQATARAFIRVEDWPACTINRFGRHDARKRLNQLSRHLVTDGELTEASRLALRSLTGRFGRAK